MQDKLEALKRAAEADDRLKEICSSADPMSILRNSEEANNYFWSVMATDLLWAADTIESQRAEIDRLRELLKGIASCASIRSVNGDHRCVLIPNSTISEILKEVSQ